MKMTKINSNIGEKITYLAVGGGIGAVLALLFAPKAGEDFRADIADATRKGLDKTEELAGQMNEKVKTAYSGTKSMATDLIDAAKEKLDHTATALKTSSAKISAGIHEGSEEIFGPREKSPLDGPAIPNAKIY